MPLDSTGYEPDDRRPYRPRRNLGSDLFYIAAVLLLVGLLVMPISMAALVDLITYFRTP